MKIFKKNEHSIIIGFHENSLKKVSEDLLSEKLYVKNISLVREILNGKFKKVKDEKSPPQSACPQSSLGVVSFDSRTASVNHNRTLCLQLAIAGQVQHS